MQATLSPPSCKPPCLQVSGHGVTLSSCGISEKEMEADQNILVVIPPGCFTKRCLQVATLTGQLVAAESAIQGLRQELTSVRHTLLHAQATSVAGRMPS